MGKQFCVAMMEMCDQSKYKMVMKELQFKYTT
jgi:hypothetical protein